MYDFTKQEEGELTIRKGQVITVIDKTDQNWWRGRVDDKEGIFPVSYVKLS